MEEGKKLKVGRPEKYEEQVKPHLEQIKKWLSQGATQKQISEELGVSYSTFREYVKKYPELLAAVKSRNNKPLVEELRSALVKKALGFEYEEKKTYVKTDPETGAKVKYVEITTRYSPPDTTAIFGAMNVYDKTYVRDRANYDLKKQELALKTALAKANSFEDLDKFLNDEE